MTQTDKLHFAAQYFGQFVMTIIEADGFEKNGCEVSGYSVGLTFNHKYFLTLKPLSSITDEDAIEVAKILNFRGDNLIENVKSFLTGNDHWLNKHVGARLYGRVIDFLRSSGYLLPFRNYSPDQLIEMGWAKIQE